MLFDHLGFNVTDFAKTKSFLLEALAPIGVTVLREGSEGGGWASAPGLRPQYHPDYYGAFVIGPDGHNIEAVCHAAEG